MFKDSDPYAVMLALLRAEAARSTAAAKAERTAADSRRRRRPTRERSRDKKHKPNEKAAEAHTTASAAPCAHAEADGGDYRRRLRAVPNTERVISRPI